MKAIAIKSLIFSLMISALTATSLYAGEIQGHRYDREYFEGDTKLTLQGVALMRYWGFKAYTGAFYLQDGATLEKKFSNNAIRLELSYMRPIKGEDFARATDHMLAKNVNEAIYERLKPRLDFYNSLYEDVKPGDRYSLTYIPGRGTELALNGVPKGITRGEDFAEAIFSIWLGDEPISDSFRDQVMGL